MISAKQIRAARGMLDWPQKTLADKSGLGVATLRLIEKDDNIMTNASAVKIRQAFEDAGLEFLENDGVGFRKDSIKTYRGMYAQDMLYDLFELAKEAKKPVYLLCKSWDTLVDFLGLTEDSNRKRFERISKKVTINCLLADSSHIQEQKLSFNFKALPGLFAAGVCHCMIGNKYIVAEPENDGGYIYLVLKSVGQHEAFYNEFKPLWEKAVALHIASNDSEGSAIAAAV